MFGYSKIKIAVICVVLVFGIFFSLPNFLPKEMYREIPSSMKEWWKPVTLGLDLQGGSYLVMQKMWPKPTRHK